jgi:ubiquinone/menaquinone biosynthesis C-methylase UbiE
MRRSKKRIEPQMSTPIPRRVNRSKQQARKFYTGISGFYDALSGGSEKRLCDLGIRQLNLQPGERVLEIGVGTGKALISFAGMIGAGGRIFGIDLSEGMLIIARNNERHAGKTDQSALICADGARLPLRSGIFDAVFLSFTLELFDTPEIPVVLAECRRSLKLSGRLGVVSMALMQKPNAMSKLYDAAHDAWPVFVDCRPIDSRRAMEEAGFSVLEFRRESMFLLPVDIVVAKASP